MSCLTASKAGKVVSRFRLVVEPSCISDPYPSSSIPLLISLVSLLFPSFLLRSLSPSILSHHPSLRPTFSPSSLPFYPSLLQE